MFRHAGPNAQAPESLFAEEVLDPDAHRKHLQQARAALNTPKTEQLTPS